MNFSFFCQRKIFSVDTAFTVLVNTNGSVTQARGPSKSDTPVRDSQIRANFGPDGLVHPLRDPSQSDQNKPGKCSKTIFGREEAGRAKRAHSFIP